MARRPRMSVQTESEPLGTAQPLSQPEMNATVFTGGRSGNERPPSNNPSASANEGVEDQQGQVKKRGKTLLNKIWNSTSRIDVVLNSRGQPIGYEAVRLSGFIGVVVRTQCPMNYASWHKVPGPTKQSLVDVIRRKFKMPSAITCWLRKTMSKKFRDYKSDMKSRYFYREKSLEWNLENRPPKFPVEAWQFLVNQWITDEGKKVEEKAKRSRSFQKVTHTTGSKSFARVGGELVAEDGTEVGQIQLFATTHTRKDNSYLDNQIREVIEKANAKKIERSATPSQDPIQDEMEIMSEVLGEERNGRVRGMGLGPTPSTVFGPFGYRKAMAHKDEEYERLNEKIDSQNAVIEALQKQVADLINLVGNNQLGSTPINGAANSSHSSHQFQRRS